MSSLAACNRSLQNTKKDVRKLFQRLNKIIDRRKQVKINHGKAKKSGKEFLKTYFLLVWRLFLQSFMHKKTASCAVVLFIAYISAATKHIRVYCYIQTIVGSYDQLHLFRRA